MAVGSIGNNNIAVEYDSYHGLNLPMAMVLVLSVSEKGLVELLVEEVLPKI